MTSPSTDTDELVLRCEEATHLLREIRHAMGLQALSELQRQGAVFADFFGESTRYMLSQARVRVEHGRPTPISNRIQETRSTGFSLRALTPSRHALVWSTSITPGAMTGVAREVATSLSTGSGSSSARLSMEEPNPQFIRVMQESWGAFLVERILDAALSADPDVAEVRVDRIEQLRSCLLLTTHEVERDIVLSHHSLRVAVRLKDSDGESTGHALGDADPIDPESLVYEAVRAARDRLGVSHEVSGEMPIVFAAGCGAWLHEAVGHTLEADAANHGHGFAIGSRVGPDCLTVQDVSGEEGVDDEGTSLRTTTLLERGVVQRHLTDQWSALRLDLPLTGNGRRASFRDLPLPRMHRLVLAPGGRTEDDLLLEAREGLYVSAIREGCLEPQHDRLRLVVDRGRRIRGGQLAESVCDGQIVASPLALLGSLREVGQSPGDGGLNAICHKDGQSLPVNVDAPPAFFSSLEVTPLL